tara:strand:- start:145 stop:249 length:105 start_codon:yes stop_codon:yes gene_type:complete
MVARNDDARDMGFSEKVREESVPDSVRKKMKMRM